MGEAFIEKVSPVAVCSNVFFTSYHFLSQLFSPVFYLRAQIGNICKVFYIISLCSGETSSSLVAGYVRLPAYAVSFRLKQLKKLCSVNLDMWIRAPIIIGILEYSFKLSVVYSDIYVFIYLIIKSRIWAAGSTSGFPSVSLFHTLFLSVSLYCSNWEYQISSIRLVTFDISFTFSQMREAD